MGRIAEFRASYQQLRQTHTDEGVGGPDEIYDSSGRVFYQPIIFMQPEGQKVVARAVTPKALWDSLELNPTHLATQNLESTIDSSHNIVYGLPNGAVVRLGFYDRSQLVSSPRHAEEGEIVGVMRELIEGRDPECPRLPILQVQPYADYLLGRSFPSMFGFRSVVFPSDRQTTYGFFVELDKAAIHADEDFDGELTREYLLTHPQMVNVLYPALVDAAKQRGLDFLDLDVADTVDDSKIREKWGYIFHLADKGKYKIKAKYQVSYAPVITTRVNGMPTSVIAENGGEPKFFEMGSLGGIDLGSSYVMPVTRWAFRNAKDPKDSEIATIVYEPISRRDSADQVARNAKFGLIEVVVCEAAALGNVSFDFIQTEAPKPVEAPPWMRERQESMFGGADIMKGGGGGEPSYTAGMTRMGEVEKVTIQTTRASFSTVLFRDFLCLVHREMSQDPMDYLSAGSREESGKTE